MQTKSLRDGLCFILLVIGSCNSSGFQDANYYRRFIGQQEPDSSKLIAKDTQDVIVRQAKAYADTVFFI
jgi:hypothetical protein